MRRNTRGYARTFDINRDRERCPAQGRIFRSHWGKFQLLESFAGRCQADQSPSVSGHEIDRLRRDRFGRHCEIALVFAIFIVDDDDHPPGSQFIQRLFNAGKFECIVIFVAADVRRL